MPWSEYLSPRQRLARFFGTGTPARHGESRPVTGLPTTGAAGSGRHRTAATGRLDLTSLRAGLGDRWEVLAPSLHRMTGRFLAIRLNGRGTFARRGDVYEIEMPRLPPARVQAECNALLAELTELIYSGRSFEEHLRTAAATAPPAPDPQPGGLRRLLRWIAGSVRRLRRDRPGADTGPPPAAPADVATVAATGTPGPAPADAPAGEAVASAVIAPAPPAIAAARLPAALSVAPSAAPSDQAAAATVGAAEVPPGPAPEMRPPAAKPPARETAIARRLREARALESGVLTAAMQRADEGLASDENAFPPPTLHFVYQPVWNVRNKMLTTYVCLPACRRPSGALLLGDRVLPQPRTAEDVLLLDMLNLEQAVRDLRERQVKGRGATTLVSTHLTTLTDPEQWPYFAEAIAAVEDDVRRRLLIEIIGLGDLRNQPRAFEVLRRVTPLCRGIIARTGLHENSLTFWKNCRVVAVGPHVGGDLRPEARIIADMNRFAMLAEHAGLPSFVRGLRSRSLAIGAIAAGFNYIAGPVMGSRFNDGVGSVRRFELSDLYAEEAEDLPAA